MSQIVFYIGLATILAYTSKVLRFIWLYSRPSSLSKCLHTSPSGSPPWAMVTGSSDGIGLGFAQELAHRGFNIILHGRNPTKLAGVKAQLQNNFPNTEFRCVILDATAPTDQMSSALTTMVSDLADIHLTVLVNNVGGQPPDRKPTYKPLETDSTLDISNMIKMNAVFPVQITAALLPILKRHGKPSVVLNMGSMAEFGAPWLSTYSGSKAFNMAWSKSMQLEQEGEGSKVEFLGVPVGEVTDCTHNRANPTFWLPSNRGFASSTLDLVGCGRLIATGYLGHALQRIFLDYAPEIIARPIFLAVVVDKKAINLKLQ